MTKGTKCPKYENWFVFCTRNLTHAEHIVQMVLYILMPMQATIFPIYMAGII
jgi:hypothetical protein